MNRRQTLNVRRCRDLPRPALPRQGRVPSWFRWCQLLSVAVALLLVQALAASVAFAQATASFFNQVGVATDTTAADACASSFSSALTGQGLVERPSTEVETMMRECVEDLANPDFVRQCDLRAAVGQVDYVMVYNVSREGEEWYFRVEALSPLQQGTVWQQGTLVAESSAVRGAMTGCSQLAQDFLVRQSFVEDEADPGATRVEDVAPVVEDLVILEPAPTPAAQPDDVLQRPVDPAPRATCTVRRLSGALLTGLGLGLAGYGAYLNNAAQVTRSPGEPWEEEVVSSERRIAGISLLAGGASVSGVGIWQAARRCRQ